MLSSTVSAEEASATAGTCGPARACARLRAGTVRHVLGRRARRARTKAAKSPAMTLKSVVLPAPFGPRIARRSPCATSRSTSRTACRPPKRRPTPRKRRVGSAFWRQCGASVNAYLMTWFVIMPFLITWILPCHGSFFFTQAGCVRPGGGLVGLNSAAERLVDVRHEADERRSPSLPSAFLTICSGYWSWIAWRFESSLTTPPSETWYADLDRPRHRRLQRRADVRRLDFVQARTSAQAAL